MTSTSRRFGAALAALALALASCSVGTNDEPVAAGALFDPLATSTTSTTSTTAPPETPTKDAVLYLIRSQDGSVSLVPVTRTVDVAAGVQEILSNLFQTRPDPENPDEVGLANPIPESAVLLSATLRGDSSELVVDVRGLFGSEGITGNPLRNALAEIVWTATEIEQVTSVSFLNNGDEINAITGTGEEADGPVNRNQYRTLG